MIVIVDYGMGNLGSLRNMFKRIGEQAIVESDPSIIERAEKLVLPGVGAFDAAMKCIDEAPGLRDVLNHVAMSRKMPILGVCLGMQLLTRTSEEGQQPGLGWIPGVTKRFPIQANLKVPHMGWNTARTRAPSQLTDGISRDARYYFVHSYCVQVDCTEHSVMRTRYGIEFDSAIGCENIYGVQFHPEKSHRFGMKILYNFANL